MSKRVRTIDSFSEYTVFFAITIAVLYQIPSNDCVRLRALNLPTSVLNRTTSVLNGTTSALNGTTSVLNGPSSVLNGTTSVLNETVSNIKKAVDVFNGTDLRNFTYSWTNGSISPYSDAETSKVDCLGLGTTVANALEWFFASKANGSKALDVRFTLSSRKQRQRVHVFIGDQFGLEWTDFRIERRTVVIVHGFLSHGGETWISEMEKAFLDWEDVNVMVVDWSAGGNTWNYYKAAVNTRIVGYQISKLLQHITNATLDLYGPDTSGWGPLHLIGHSLGAHICGFAAKELKKIQNKWLVQRITGLDPAQPCFKDADPSVNLHKSDAPFVDIIHTNGRLLVNLGLGLPGPLGHVDFYPNGGKRQPGCVKSDPSYFDFLPIHQNYIRQAICSHGRSYVYLTESLIAATANNCSFWGHHWDLTYRNAIQIISEPCDDNICTEMGIKAEIYPHRGSFFVATTDQPPFCGNSTDIIDEVRAYFEADNAGELED